MIHGQVPVEFLHRTGRAERVIARRHIDRRLIEHRRHHLRGHKPLPDELVQLEHVVAQERSYVLGRPGGIGRTNGFVRVLRILLGLEEIRLLGQVRLAISGADQAAHLVQRVIRNAHRIRAHISDQRDRAFLAQFHAFIEPLREAHGALGRVAQAIVGGLLKL